jgi:hypothetical protein
MAKRSAAGCASLALELIRASSTLRSRWNRSATWITPAAPSVTRSRTRRPPVAGDDLGAWVLAEPGRQGGDLVIRQHIDRAPHVRSTKIKPYCCRRWKAKSSTPSVSGAAPTTNRRSPSRRGSVSGLIGTPPAREGRAPSSVPGRCANASSKPVTSSVRRLYRCSCPVKRAAKISSGHVGSSQKNRRAQTRSRTVRFRHGRSMAARRYQLRSRRPGVSYIGQMALTASGTTLIVTEPSSSIGRLAIRQRSAPTRRSSASTAAPPSAASVLAI